MDSMWILYWITRAINLREMAGAGFFLCTVALVFTGFFYTIICSEGISKLVERIFVVVASLLTVLIFFFGFCYIFMPTKQEAAVIVAGGAVVEAAKTETAQRIAGKSVQILENSLDNILGKQAMEKDKSEKNNSH